MAKVTYFNNYNIDVYEMEVQYEFIGIRRNSVDIWNEQERGSEILQETCQRQDIVTDYP